MNRKLTLALVAAAAAVAAAPAANASIYTFDFTGPITSGPVGTIALNGVFTTSGAPNVDGGLPVTSFTGDYTDSENGVSGAISLYPGTSSYESHLTSTDGSWYYDNLFYPNQNAPGTSGGEFDYYGLLWYVGPVGNPHEWEVNFWSNTSTTYQLEESLTGSTQDYLNSATGIGITRGGGAIVSPEPGPSVLFGVGIMGLALLVGRKARRPELA
jgi:hypothetical protein